MNRINLAVTPTAASEAGCAFARTLSFTLGFHVLFPVFLHSPQSLAFFLILAYAFITLSPTVSGSGRFSGDFVRIFSIKSGFLASNNSSTGVKPVESATVVFHHSSILGSTSAHFLWFWLQSVLQNLEISCMRFSLGLACGSRIGVNPTCTLCSANFFLHDGD